MEQPESRFCRVILHGWSLGSIVAVMVILLFSTMYLLSQTNTPFIYFRF